MNGPATGEEKAEVERLKQLPREVGVLLTVIGVGGLILPGPIGTPFLLMGGVVLWPRAFERLELGFARRFPETHRRTTRQLHRYLDDLHRRYPDPRDDPSPSDPGPG